jgi:hypothetical protein
MKMSIARALKERKRIIGEMNTLWNRIGNNNLVQKNIKLVDGKFIKPSKEEFAAMRKQDPKALMESWKKLQQRLIAFKVALHAANTGIVEKLARLSEMKSELKQIECMGAYTDSCEYCNADFVRIYDVVFDANWQTENMDAIRKDINALQDEIDEYNATHFIEIAD